MNKQEQASQVSGVSGRGGHAVCTQTDRQIMLTREFEAPRPLVWQMWTDPAHLGRWWGPVGFTTSTSRMEFRAGGQWQFVMHGPDGTDYQNLVTYLEIREPELIRYKQGGAADREPINFEVVVKFEQAGAGRTRLTLRMDFATTAAKEWVVRNVGAIEGGKQTLARLAEHLAGEVARGEARVGGSGAANEPLVISRVVRAPREKAWEVWTTLEHLERWFGPKGTTLAKCSLDLRPGGTFHYLMRGCGPKGDEVWARWVIRRVTPLERLEIVISFSNEGGGITRAPWDGGWPLEMLATVTFSEHAGLGRGTVVRVEVAALGATEGEQRTFDGAFESMRGGWDGTLDRLEGYVAK